MGFLDSISASLSYIHLRNRLTRYLFDRLKNLSLNVVFSENAACLTQASLTAPNKQINKPIYLW